MKFRLDHVVIAVGDLDQAVRDYQSLGFTVKPGGRHPTRTTHNALIVFGDGAYIELIAWLSPMKERWFDTHARHGDGLIDFALLPEDTSRAISEARSRGLTMTGPEDGGRLRPDGAELKWQTARQPSLDLPFLCGDLTPRDLRVETGPLRQHANGASGIASVAVGVRDADATMDRYLALLGVDARGGGDVHIARAVVLPGAGLGVASIGLGKNAIVFIAPSAEEATAPSSYARDLAKRLSTRGEGPCALAISTTAGGEGRLLDPAMTHGVVIEMR